ncbi:MAG: tRNA (N6-threonylcarbamoyladenosine(37)-N6)-methyltransferase TrmO [Flavobacteriaceae bacterium]
MLGTDPAKIASDAGIVFIGRVRTPWSERGDCPRNLREARERGGETSLLLDGPYRPGLDGLEPGRTVIVLYWLDRARRDLIVQKPRYRETATGVFNLRSPVRPNSIGIAITEIRAVDMAAGRVETGTLDCIDGTPLIDIKPWFESTDLPPGFTKAE